MAHPLLKSLRACTPAFGVWITFPSVHTARQIALAGRTCGLAWIGIDCEHGLISLVPGVADVVAAVASLPPPGAPTPPPPSVLVRIPAPGLQYSGPSTAQQIKHVLDAGAHGVIVPMVCNAAIARQVALDARFPPDGRRGFGSPFSHQVWGIDDPSEYRRRANEQIIVCIQIESREAVENIEEIAETEGVDVLLIGPFDLSLALGYPTPNPHPYPEVEEVIQNIKKIAHKHGKKVAYFCTSGTQAKKRADEGFDVINIQSDVGALTEGLVRSLADAEGRPFTFERKGGY